MNEQNENNKKVVVTSLSQETINYLHKIDKEKLNPTFGQMTVKQLLREFDDQNYVVNHKYQRKPGQWSEYMNQLFLLTLLEQGIVQPLVLADMSLIDATHNKRELIDGQQRVHLMKKWANDEIRLPMYLPEDIRGKSRSELPPEVVEKIDGYNVMYMSIQPKNEDQIYTLYNRIQKGSTFTFGQDIKGHQGTFKQLVVNLSKHPFMKHATGVRDEWELQYAGYLYISILYENGIHDITTFHRNQLTEYLEVHANDEIPNEIFKACYERAELLQEIFEQHSLTDITAVDLIVLSSCLNKALTNYTRGVFLPAMGRAFKKYIEKIEEIQLFNRLHKEVNSPFDERYVHSIKNSPYYVPCQNHSLTRARRHTESFINLLWGEFEECLN